MTQRDSILSTHGSWTHVLLTGLVLAIFASVAFHGFGHHFLLIEYRQQVFWDFFNPFAIFNPSSLFDDTAMSIAFSRAFFLLTNSAVGKVCGLSLLCHNAFHIALLTSGAGLVAAMLRLLFPNSPALLSAATLVFLLFSVPVFDSVSWQATVLDQLSLFFTALGLLLVSRIDLGDRRIGYLCAVNLLLLLLVILAYNSKEASFSLVPSMALLLLVRHLAVSKDLDFRSGLRAVRHSAAALALPILYCAFHVTIVLIDRTMINIGENARVLGGSAFSNTPLFVRYFLNLDVDHPFTQRGWTNVAIIGGCLAAAVVAAAAARGRRLTVLMLLWALVCFAMASAIPLRTTAASPFYLLVPQYYLSIVFFLAFLLIWDALPQKLCQIVVPLAVAAFLFGHIKGLVRSYAIYDQLSTMSANFVPALQRLAEALAEAPPDTRLVILRPEKELRAYMFVGRPTQRTLAPFLLPPGTPKEVIEAMDERIVDEPYEALPPDGPAPRPDELVAVLGERLRLDAIVPPPVQQRPTAR
jgi:hypothetical protein